MRDFHDDVRRQLAEALADGLGSRVVNLCGPLGSGKSTVAADVVELVRGAVRVLDGVDSAQAAGEALAVVEGMASEGSATRLLIVGRRPIRSWPGWGRIPVRTIRVGLWPGSDVRRLGRSLGVSDAARLDLLVDLAGGLLLAADVLGRALGEVAVGSGGSASQRDHRDRAGHADRAALATGGRALGADRTALAAGRAALAAVRGGLADQVSQAILARLRTELADVPADTLHVLAALGGADADLLAAVAAVTAGEFDRVSALSLVEIDRLGRTVAEPYRTVFDLAYRWRHPVAADAVLGQASAHRRRQIAASRDPVVRGELSERVMRATAPPQVRRAFFPPSAATFQARPATVDDERDVVRLVRQWACSEGLDRRRADRMLEAWMTAPVTGFHLLFDAQGRVVSLANLTPLADASAPVLEALLQQHAAEFARPARPAEFATPSASTGPTAPSGHLVGMLTAAGRRPAARGAMLRHILNVAIPSGRIVVSTSWPPYRFLAENIGLRAVGETREDLFRCGRRNRVLERTFAADSIGPWLRRMERTENRPDPLLEEIRNALGSLRTPQQLNGSPLLTLPHLATPSALAGFLRRQIEDLAASDVPADAEAGRILHRYFVLRNAGHDALIHRAHLSRATYFRRLDHGIRLIAQAARLLAGPTG
ncbi:MAG: hypothetical protein HOV83_01125 [Catenulispora sp.]|nr:hypothetical protein [Catenulispora sp.]